MTNHKHTDTSRSGDLVKECRLDAKAFRENTVYDSDGDPIRLIANAERLDQYADRIEALQQRVRELEEALRPFAFLEMEKDEGLADTQYVWEVIYQDRVQDWIAYEDIAAARKALGDTHD